MRNGVFSSPAQQSVPFQPPEVAHRSLHQFAAELPASSVLSCGSISALVLCPPSDSQGPDASSRGIGSPLPSPCKHPSRRPSSWPRALPLRPPQAQVGLSLRLPAAGSAGSTALDGYAAVPDREERGEDDGEATEHTGRDSMSGLLTWPVAPCECVDAVGEE